jgi:hypothetical protein
MRQVIGGQMRQAAYTLLLMMAFSRGSAASEVIDAGPLRNQDWRKPDRVQWATDSYNLPTLQALRARVASYASTNTFILAFAYNLGHNSPAEYASVTQRNQFYDYATLLLESAAAKPEISQVRFFHATTIVTSWSAIGAVENSAWDNPILRQVGSFLGSNTSDQNDAVALLRDINAQLFARNLPIINKLLNTWDQPRDPRNNRRTLNALDFDLAMVDFEQDTVQDVLSRRRPRPEIIKTIGNLSRFRGAIWTWDRIGGGHPLDIAATWAEAAGYHPNDFGDLSNRVAIGRALVFYLHGQSNNQTLDQSKQAYLDYMHAHLLRAPASSADEEEQWRAWTAGQGVLMAGDSRGLVPILYGIATREALARPEGNERQTVITDFAGAIRSARDIHNFADYQALVNSTALKKYSVAEALPPFSILGSDSLTANNTFREDPGSIEKMYRTKIVVPSDPGVLLAAGRIIPAAGQVISDLSSQIFSVPQSTTGWNWNILRTASAFTGNPATQQLTSVLQSPNTTFQSAISKVANTLDTSAIRRASDAVDALRSASAGVTDIGSLASRIQTSGLPAEDLQADAARPSERCSRDCYVGATIWR